MTLVGQGEEAAQQRIADAVSGGINRVDQGVTAANEGLTESQRQQIALLQPYIDSGQISLDSLKELAGATGPLAEKFSFGQEDLDNDPGYQFTLSEGQKAIQRAAAARGGLFSSGTLKALAGYTTGSANTYFNDAFNRAKTTFDTNRDSALSRINTLKDLAGFGFSGSSQASSAVGDTEARKAANLMSGAETGADLGFRGGLAGADMGFRSGVEKARIGTDTARGVAQALTNKGIAEAEGTVRSTNSWLGTLMGGTKALTDYLSVARQK